MPNYAFANIEQYAAHQVDPIPEAEEPVIETLLDDAGLWLRRFVEVDPTDCEKMALLAQVNVNMVKRAMVSASAGAFGVDQASATMGPFQQSMRYANPNGDFYLTGAEKSALGIDEGYISTIPPVIGGYYA